MFRNKTPRKAVKCGLDKEEARMKREEVSISLRKNKRDEQLQKRRQMTDNQTTTPSSSNTITVPTGAEALKMLPNLVTGLNSNDPAGHLPCLTAFRKMLSIENNPPIQEVVDAGIVPRLVQFLGHPQHQLQFEAAWTLTNIASGSSKHTNVVVAAGAVPIFIRMLRSQHEDVSGQAVWALGNIAGDSSNLRNICLSEGIMEPLLALLTPNAPIALLRNGAWTISNLCRGKPQPSFDHVHMALPTLVQMIYSHDDEVVVDALWALSYLSDDNDPRGLKIQAVLSQPGLCQRLVELLLHRSTEVKTPALRTLGNIVTGSDTQTQTVLDCSVLPNLAHLMNHTKAAIRKETCWTLSNITAGSSSQIQAVIEARILPLLNNALQTGEHEVQKEACWAIANACSGGTPEQVAYMAENGIIAGMVEMLSSADGKLVLVALGCLATVLKVGKKLGKDEVNKYADLIEEYGGLDTIESLQRHENEEIYNKAVKILQKYFDSEEEEEEAANLPQVQQNQFVFGSNSSSQPSQPVFSF